MTSLSLVEEFFLLVCVFVNPGHLNEFSTGQPTVHQGAFCNSIVGGFDAPCVWSRLY